MIMTVFMFFLLFITTIKTFWEFEVFKTLKASKIPSWFYDEKSLNVVKRSFILKLSPSIFQKPIFDSNRHIDSKLNQNIRVFH